MSNDVTRRRFLEGLALGAAAGPALPLLTAESISAAQKIPRRVLGRTGAKVSILAFGCGSRFLKYEDEDQALAALNHAIDLGISYLDTAYAYGEGKSEMRVGKVMATRRKEVFLATKAPDRTRDDLLRRIEGSLKRLQTDQVDLLHIHSLRNEDDLAKIEAPDGALKGLLEAREQKLARFIGMTSHTNGEVMAQAIARHDLDCVQMSLNPTRNGRFEELALPAANKKNLGIIAMKVTGQDFINGTGEGKAAVDSLLRYSMGLPVTTAVIGMPHMEYIDQNVAVARAFKPLEPVELEKLRNDLGTVRDALEKRLVGHLDGPTMTPEIFHV
ncbi:MAG: aldo/keto reductase [Acidobacteria bacterium]|nr:aldo/keto reductase [Acidobacteriota bacterium]